MTDSTETSLNGALRTLIDDLIADRSTALSSFETWCLEHSEDIQLMTLIRELEPPMEGETLPR